MDEGQSNRKKINKIIQEKSTTHEDGIFHSLEVKVFMRL